MESYLKQLEGLGLADKEAKVYLASLELGAATAQQIAAKAAVVRPTAYVAIGGLIKRGLMSQFTKGKKQYYTAEKPDRLMKLVQDEKKKISEQEEKLKAILPGLSSLISLAGEKPEVKFYEGLEGLEAIRNVLFESKMKHIDVIIGSTSKFNKAVPEESRILYTLKTRKLGITGRQIVISGNAPFRAPEIPMKGWQFKVSKKKYINTASDIAIFDNYVSLVAYLDKPFGFLVKSAEISTLARSLFDMAWKSQ